MTPDVREALSDCEFYYGWVVVAACFLGAVAAFGTMYSFSVFFAHIATEFEQSAANTSAIFSLQSLVTYGGAAVVGLYVDRVGARRFLGLAIVFVGVGLFGASQLRSLPGVAVSYGVVAAAGFAIVIPIAFATAPRWFDRRRGLANGLATSGAGVGLVLAPPFANALIEAVGWRDAYLGFTVVVVATLGLGALVLADRPRDLNVDTGAEFASTDGGTTQDGAVTDDGTAQDEAVTDDGTAQDEAVTDDQTADVLGELRSALGSGSFLLVFAAVMLSYVPIYVVIVYLVEFADTTGIGRATGVLAVTVVGVVSIVGRNAVGIASDRFGHARLLAVCGATLGLATAAFTVAPSPATLLVCAAVFGVGYGGASPLVAPLLAELFGTESVYALFGLTSIAWAISGSAGPYLAGLGYDVTGTYVPVFVAAGTLGLVAAGAFLLSARLSASQPSG